MPRKNLNDLRDKLFETLDELKSGKIDVSQAKAVKDIGDTIIESGKLELDYINKLGLNQQSHFILEGQGKKRGHLPSTATDE